MNWETWYQRGFNHDEVDEIMETKRAVVEKYVAELMRSTKTGRGLGMGAALDAKASGDALIKKAPWQDFNTVLGGQPKLSAAEEKSLFERYVAGSLETFDAWKTEVEALKTTAPGTVHFVEELYTLVTTRGGIDLQSSGAEPDGITKKELMQQCSVGFGHVGGWVSLVHMAFFVQIKSSLFASPSVFGTSFLRSSSDQAFSSTGSGACAAGQRSQRAGPKPTSRRSRRRTRKRTKRSRPGSACWPS